MGEQDRDRALADAMLDRRRFISLAVTGAAAFGLTGAIGLTAWPALTDTTTRRRRLAITEALVEMVDRRAVYHWAFEDLDRPGGGPQMPGPLLEAFEGDDLELEIVNRLPHRHGFRIPGADGDAGLGVVIDPGATVQLRFSAPAAGSYLYFDHLDAPVNRVLGLHGPMVILPRESNTPYSRPTPAVQQLFDDLGALGHFPGEPWLPERTKVWVFNSVDPRFNERARLGQPIDAERFVSEFLPTYFTINGLSGHYAAHDKSVVPRGRIGQPHVIRLMNAGLCWHSPHQHGNAFYVLARVGADLERQAIERNVAQMDTVTLRPLERMDWLHPFVRPADIPGDPRLPLRQTLARELSMVVGGVPQSPLRYPMHCHMEMSQTAGGGNYPQGAVTHWELTGDVDGVDFPHVTAPAASASRREGPAADDHDPHAGGGESR